MYWVFRSTQGNTLLHKDDLYTLRRKHWRAEAKQWWGPELGCQQSPVQSRRCRHGPRTLGSIRWSRTTEAMREDELEAAVPGEEGKEHDRGDAASGCRTPHIPGVRVSNSDGNQQSRADRLEKKVNREVGSSSKRLCLLQDTSGRTEGKLKKRETARRAVKSGTRELLRKEECSTDQGTSAPSCYMSA